MSAPIRGAVFGRSGSGKTEWQARVLVPTFPRVLIRDGTGEWKRRDPNAIFTVGESATRAALVNVAHRSRWTIVADLNTSESHAVAAMLLPRGELYESFPYHVGGMLWLIEEADQVIPFRPQEAILDAFRRSRHANLSVVASTQRPNISKEVTSQADFITIFALHEPRDVEYFYDVMGQENSEKALAWVNADVKHRAALFRTQDRSLHLLDPLRL